MAHQPAVALTLGTKRGQFGEGGAIGRIIGVEPVGEGAVQRLPLDRPGDIAHQVLESFLRHLFLPDVRYNAQWCISGKNDSNTMQFLA